MIIFSIVISILVTLTGISFIYFGSTREDDNKISRGLGILSIYFQLVLGLMILSGILLGILLLMMMYMNFILTLILGLIFGLYFVFNYKLLQKAINVLDGLKDIIDPQNTEKSPEVPNLLSLRNYLIILFILFLGSQLLGSTDLAAEGERLASLPAFIENNVFISSISQVLTFLVMAYTIFLVHDLDQHMAEYNSFT